MSCVWMRRALLAAASAAALVLAACGSGTIESELRPSRIVAFGDGLADLGQTGSTYTVNDGGANIWTQRVAVAFGLDLKPAAIGGTSFATGNARVSRKPDAAGNGATPTVAEQIDAFLGRGPFDPNDLLIVNAGTADVVAEMAKVTAGTQTSEQMLAELKQVGRDLAAQVRRLVDAGAPHIVVVGTYDLGRSPWARAPRPPAQRCPPTAPVNHPQLGSMVARGRHRR